MLGRAIGCVCCSFTVALGRPAPAGAPPGALTIGPVPAPGAPGVRGAAGMGFRGTVLAIWLVAAPVSILGAPGAGGAAGRGMEGGEGGAIGTVAAGGGGAPGRAGGGIAPLGAGGAEGAMGGGNFTGEDADFGAGGGSGAEGSWIGAVAFFGVMEGAGGIGTLEVTGLTGAVASRGCTAPSPGRARRVMRTVSFLSGTAEVFGVLGGGGVGRFSDSLMGEMGGK